MKKEVKTSWLLAITGIAAGVTAVLLLPLIKKRMVQGTIEPLMPTVKRSIASARYTTSAQYDD